MGFSMSLDCSWVGGYREGKSKRDSTRKEAIKSSGKVGVPLLLGMRVPVQEQNRKALKISPGQRLSTENALAVHPA